MKICRISKVTRFASPTNPISSSSVANKIADNQKLWFSTVPIRTQEKSASYHVSKKNLISGAIKSKLQSSHDSPMTHKAKKPHIPSPKGEGKAGNGHKG